MSGPLVVVGDALLDVDVTGVVRRMCPDAPAPVLDVQQERARPGGAALAASLAASDGVPVVLATMLADDEPAQWLRRMLTGRVELVHGTTDASTPVKTRLRCEGHSLARFDRGGGRGVLRVGEDVLDAVAGAAAVLVSDYGRGLSSDQRLRKVLRDVARHVPVVWDPHPLGAPSVPDVHLVTPNQAEVAAIIGCDASTFRGAEHAVHALRERWHVRGVAITMGRHGALLGYGAAAPVAVPAAEVSVADPCGAGDRFAATSAIQLRAGAALDEAVAAAVASATDFLRGGGAAAFDPSQPLASGEPSQRAHVRALIAAIRAKNGTVVATGGCFDLLHTGHIRTLAAARALGDCLVVCLNSDASVRRIKGPQRPINGLDDRAELLRSLSSVDAVVVFDEDTPEAVLAELRPDIWVKGSDYSVESLQETDLVRSWGGRTVVVPYVAGRSTTRLASSLASSWLDTAG